VLGRLAFPGAALGCAESTARRLQEDPGAAQRRLRDFDREHYVERAPLSLGQVQVLPVPGRLEVGDRELDLFPAEGHTVDGMAIWDPGSRVLVCGDYISPIERPMVDGDATEYAATLERLRPLAEQADWVVPGHGAPLRADRALEILADHLAEVTS
jgi:glyoxylase-like metal-dependent hydrolase (beta-lactamase superfamily II)